MAIQCFGAEIVLNKSIPELVLKDGRVLKNVTFVALGSTTAMAKWDGGRGTLRLDLLPDDLVATPQDLAPAATDQAVSTPTAPFDRTKAPPAETLAAQSLAAEGGAAMMALHAVRFQGEIGPEGEGTPVVMVMSQPNFRRTEVLLPQGRYIEGYGPEGAWYAGQKTGGIPVLGNPATRSSVKKDDLEESFIEPLWRWKELNARLDVIGEELVALPGSTHSIRTYVVSVSVPDGSRWDYLVPADDAQTPYLEKRTYQGGRMVGTERRSRFRRVGDLTVAMDYETDNGDGRMVEMRFFRVVLDPELDPGTFVGPSAGSKGARL